MREKIILKPEEIKEIPRNAIVDTNFLSPCFGIILYDRENKNGAYAGHFATPESGSLQVLLERSKSKFRDLSQIEVYCVGSSPGGKLTDTANRYVQWTLGGREFVVRKFKEYGLKDSNTYIGFSQEPEHFSKLKLDTKTGKTKHTIWGEERKIIYKGSLPKQ